MTTIAIISFIFAAYMLMLSFMVKTKNFMSMIIFKFIPYLISMWLLAHGLSIFKIINTPMNPVTPEIVETAMVN